MFTGIVTDLGRVRAVAARGDRRFEIATAYAVEEIAIGASIACNGCCLTVTETGRGETGRGETGRSETGRAGDGAGWFAVDASAETLSRTTLGEWDEGTPVNLERALRLGDELGGHFVLGHVDAVATVTDRWAEGDSWRFGFEAPADLAKYLAPKGSVVIDGVSLTVNAVEGARFGVNIIPHTYQVTRFGTLEPGDRVNLEVDALARYVARLLGQEQDGPTDGG